MIEHLIRAATCRVSSGNESGTGWLIAKDLVITARHCVLPAIVDGKPVELFFLDTGDVCVSSKIVAESEVWDACLLSLATTTAAEPLSVSLGLPREGETWETFGYPEGKVTFGHRLSGTVAQVLETPKLKIDLDLSIDPTVALQVYRGMSGAPVVRDGLVLGIIRLKLDGTVAALSLKQLESFLADNGVDLPNDSTTPAAPLLADWGDFPQGFSEVVRDRAGSYLFLEGTHGSGKTTFCGGFKADDKTLINLGAYHLSDPASVLGADYRAQPQVFVDWLTTKVSGLIIGQSARKEEKKYAEQILQVAQYLASFSEYCAKSSRQGMLFIDGLNEVPGDALLGQLVGLLPRKLPPHITVVFSAPNFDNIAAALGGRVKTADVFELPPLSQSACYRYCLQALKPERKSAALVDRICEKANGHPLYLRYLIEYANYQEADNDLNEFPILSGPIEEYYQGIWFKLLPDNGAVNLLALMTRLRWGVPLSDFAKILTPAEQAQFVSVLSRIRHLLADEESTTIYHASFAAFIIEQTAGIAEPIYQRLAKFCREQPTVRYCALNLVFHLYLASDNAVFSDCTQSWFDAAVTLGVEPDALIADVDAVVHRAATEAPAEEFFRLMLLAQRISFRYDTLFAQSARLIAEALIVIARPGEALQHVLRLKTLLVGPDDALKISFLLHQHGYDSEALTLLNRVQRLVVESYDSPLRLKDFLALCSWHIQSVFLVRLSGGWNGMEQVSKIIEMARRNCEEVFEVHPSKVDEYLGPILAGSATYFLTFRDEYADLQRLKEFQKAEGLPEAEISPHYLRTQCIALLEFENTVEGYHLPKNRKALNRTFTDLAELISTGEIEAPLAAVVTDTLIRFGAPASIVELFAEKGKEAPQPIQIKAPNGVDVNHEGLKECLWAWRIAAFLDSKFLGPSAGIIAGTGWFESIEHLIGALYCCDGQARRAKADANEVALTACRRQLEAQVIEPLRFTLQQRAAWPDSYAIPETALPSVYRQLAELLNDCFPEDVPEWLDNLTAAAEGQWGMYSEGFRASAFYVLDQLTRERPVGELATKLLGLLCSWRDHVLRGVENRHELVPEILRMIPLFAHLGANEEAERLYQRLLSVSMGPTWYKEDQLGLMTEALASVPVTEDVRQQLPKIAGYLEKASGEMTFQRFIRAEKSSLLGQIARHGKFRAALAYFRRQCCGSTAELWAEAQQGPIDKVGSLKGNRFPGGALDDQAAILALVRNSKTVSWALRWALLEIFHCGDSRHLTDYAEAFAKIANEVGATSELVQRAEIVVKAETSSDDRSAFESAFGTELKSELHEAFETVLVDVPTVELPEPPTPAVNRKIEDDDADVRLFNPGVFGTQNSLREAETMLEEAEKEWSLGNRNSAKAHAVRVLQIAQEGGWGIWGNLSNSARRAEEILLQQEESAANVIRYYAPLIEAERYVAKWIPAQHLIGRVGALLNETESQRLLDAVIDHFRHVVGDAQQEIQTFDFLADDSPELSPDVEVFRFIVWLCNHPQWLRRERAAAMLLWLVERVPELFSEAVTTAFSMQEGYGADVLCGVLDCASVREPQASWDKIVGVLDVTKVTQELRHISRMAVLERLAIRADKEDLPSAKSALGLIRASFTAKRLTDSNPKLPLWASSLAQEWRQIANLVDNEFVTAWERQLEKLCAPLSIKDAMALEKAVSTTFREAHNGAFNRWESKLRHSLNLVLWQHVSHDVAQVAEATLRPYNPSAPERTVVGMNNSVTDQLVAAIKSGDYSGILGQSASVLLNYHDVAVTPDENGVFHVEVLCVLQPASDQWGSFDLQLDQSFKSSELPVASTVKTPFETCCRLEPDLVFFGTFTPATPLPFFQNLVEATDNDFVRQNWRYGRRNQDRGFGRPERVGCSLWIPRKALKIPPGFKLAWIIWLDDEVVTVVDEHNNLLR